MVCFFALTFKNERIILAVIIFIAMFVLIVTEIVERHIVSLVSALLTMILAEIFCANLGGSAIMCGDPPNIIIGTSLGYSFMDFVTNTGVMAFVSLIFVLVYFYLVFKKDLVSKAGADMDYSTLPTPESAITDRKGFIVSTIIFLVTVVLLVTHAQTGLTVSTIGTLVAIVTLVFAGKNAIMLLKKVDYKTIGFFIGLFVVIGGLEQTGVLEIVAGFIGEISGGNIMVMLAIILWLSAIASAIVDNIPFATTMIPIIKVLSAAYGVDLSVLSWTLAMGTALVEVQHQSEHLQTL